MSISRLGDECSPIYTRREKHWDDPANCHHALAALCLYQQPFGFSQEDVKALRAVLDTNPTDDSADDGEVVEHWATWELRAALDRCESLLSRIASLLPPQS